MSTTPQDKPEQVPAFGSDAHLKALMKAKGVIESGYAGVNKLGHIVDRREHPEATPIQQNSMFNTPKPKPLNAKAE